MSRVEASKESNTSPTDVEEQLQLADGDAVLKCFSPLLYSMKVSGLYFTQASRRIHDASTSISGTTGSKVTRKWNGGRIYAIVIMMVFWLNAGRLFTVFDKADKFGAVLLLKLAVVSGQLFSALQQTACFVACNTRNLDRMFSGATLPKSDVGRYRRLAVIHTIVCWFLLMVQMSILLPWFTMHNMSLDFSMTPLGVHVFVSDHVIMIADVMTTLLLILTEYTYLFSHSVNYMVSSILYDQFRALNKDFHNAIGHSGEFQGRIREFRRRHQKLSQSVQNADQFMMISNVAGFCCQIVNLILILYCTIFFRNETVSKDAISAIMYAVWLASTVFSLTFTACQGIVINHVVCYA